MRDPRGYRAAITNIGLRPSGDDFTALVSAVPATCAAVFTRSRFAGPSVEASRAALAAGAPRGVVVLARNANVATGAQGLTNAREIQATVAGSLGLSPPDLLIASTGSIGKQYPMHVLRPRLAALAAPFPPADFDRMAEAMMTRDSHPKIVRAVCGPAAIVAVAKGVSMMEPDMATLLAFFCTDAQLDRHSLDHVFRDVVGVTFNAVSVDSDTSTSDTAAVFANGLAGPVPQDQFAEALHRCALDLAKMVARDGVGATKLVEVAVRGARDTGQARRVAKSVVNSPLVKAAMHGGDPDWGRVAAAIGKCADDTDIDQHQVRIGFGGLPAYPAAPGQPDRERLAAHVRGDHVVIDIDLGLGAGTFTAYGCDLTEMYVRVNSS